MWLLDFIIMEGAEGSSQFDVCRQSSPKHVADGRRWKLQKYHEHLHALACNEASKDNAPDMAKKYMDTRKEETNEWCIGTCGIWWFLVANIMKYSLEQTRRCDTKIILKLKLSHLKYMDTIYI